MSYHIFKPTITGKDTRILDTLPTVCEASPWPGPDETNLDFSLTTSPILPDRPRLSAASGKRAPGDSGSAKKTQKAHMT